MVEGKGGSDAAFFLFLFAVAVLGFGGSLQYSLAVLRAGGFGAALFFLWGRKKEPVRLGPYALLVGGFVVLSLGHSFSSTYFWVSFQHSVNIALAAVLLAWAVRWFRRNPGRAWDTTILAVSLLALAEVGIALFQRFHGGDLRPSGTFDNANYLCEFLAAASVLCLSRCFWSGRGGTRRIAEGGGAILFLAAAFFLSSSRGVLLASVPAFGVLLACRFGLRRGGAILAGIGVPALALLGWRVAGRFVGPDLYNYSRWIMWKSALRTFLDHPFGVGLGGFKYYWFATQSPVGEAFRRYGKFAATAHNEYLEVLSGLGAVGFLLFLSVLAVPLLLGLRGRGQISGDLRPVAAGAASCLVLSGAHALFNSNLHVFGIFFLDAVMLGALLTCLAGERSPETSLPSWTRGVAMTVCAGLLVASVATGAGACLFDRGERFLRSGDLREAERAFRNAMSVDPFRSTYPDALSNVYYRRYLEERSLREGAGQPPEPLFEALRWEDRARQLAPRELLYTLRLSQFFFDLFRLRGDPSDAQLSLHLAEGALQINPFGVEILWHKADVLSSLGDGEGAFRVLEDAISVEPNFCRGYARLADLARETGVADASRWSRAAEECRRRAAARVLEENEKWLVEPPEHR